MTQLFAAKGIGLRAHDGLKSLGEAQALGGADLFLVDLDTPELQPAALRQVADSSGRASPIVGLAVITDSKALFRASAVRAADLLSRPMQPERLFDACRRALNEVSITHQLVGASAAPTSEPVLPARTLSRGLVVCQDAGLLARIQAAGLARHLQLDFASTVDEALARESATSHAFVVVDAHRLPGATRIFLRDFRSLPGIGLVPLLVLLDEVSRPLFRGLPLERIALSNRLGDVGAALKSLLAPRANDSRRIFTRHAVSWAGELRVGGRAHACRIVNVSRGGMMLEAESMPALGASVSLVTGDAKSANIHLRATVARVALAHSAEGADIVSIGVTYQQFVADGEALLIEAIGRVEKTWLPPSQQSRSDERQPEA